MIKLFILVVWVKLRISFSTSIWLIYGFGAGVVRTSFGGEAEKNRLKRDTLFASRLEISYAQVLRASV